MLLMITHRGRQVAGVRYDVVYQDEILETYDTGGSGRIRQLIEKCDRNPGMSIVAEAYQEPEVQTDDEIILSRRQVYPVPSTS